MRANKPSYLISSEINLWGGKTDTEAVKGDTAGGKVEEEKRQPGRQTLRELAVL